MMDEINFCGLKLMGGEGFVLQVESARSGAGIEVKRKKKGVLLTFFISVY